MRNGGVVKGIYLSIEVPCSESEGGEFDLFLKVGRDTKLESWQELCACVQRLFLGSREFRRGVTHCLWVTQCRPFLIKLAVAVISRGNINEGIKGRLQPRASDADRATRSLERKIINQGRLHYIQY